MFFLSSFSPNSDDQLSSNVHRFVILCIRWDTTSENTGLWQLPMVYPPFNNESHHKLFDMCVPHMSLASHATCDWIPYCLFRQSGHVIYSNKHLLTDSIHRRQLRWQFVNCLQVQYQVLRSSRRSLMNICCVFTRHNSLWMMHILKPLLKSLR